MDDVILGLLLEVGELLEEQLHAFRIHELVRPPHRLVGQRDAQRLHVHQHRVISQTILARERGAGIIGRRRKEEDSVACTYITTTSVKTIVASNRKKGKNKKHEEEGSVMVAHASPSAH